MIAVIEDSEEDVALYKRTILSGLEYEHYPTLGSFLDSGLDFDVIIIDLSLPDAYAGSAIKTVQDHCKGEILVVTGLAGMYLSGRAYANMINLGAFEVFTKENLFAEEYSGMVRGLIVSLDKHIV